MLSLKADDIYDVAKPLHICSQLIGITSFNITRQSENFVDSVTWRNILCIAASTVWSATVALIFIFNMNMMWEIKALSLSAIFVNSMFCVLLAFLTITILSNWWIFTTRKYFARTLNLLMQVDEELERMKVPINLRKHKKIVVIFIVFAMTGATMSLLFTKFIGIDLYFYKIDCVFLMTMFICMETNLFFVYHFTFFMWAVKLRYQNINFFLKENFFTSPNEDVKDRIGKLNAAALLHDKLVDVSECINRCYGVPVRTNFNILLTLKRISKYFSSWR